MLTRDLWLTRHPFLRPLAELDHEVQTVIERTVISLASPQDFESYSADYRAGVPLLQSAAVAVDVETLTQLTMGTLLQLSQRSGLGELASQCRDLHSQFSVEGGSPPQAIATFLQEIEASGDQVGALRYVAWKVMRVYFAPLLRSFDTWHREEHWLLSYCPICASLPTMAQLTGKEPGRMRHLHCPCCGTRWRFRRTGCPFCERADDHRLSILSIDGEADLRLDVCESCSGYLKTYSNEGHEALIFSDWATLHLDVLAQDRGLLCAGTPLLGIAALGTTPRNAHAPASR